MNPSQINGYITIANVEHLTSLSRVKIYAMEKHGEFPTRHLFSEHRGVWTTNQITVWMQERLDRRLAPRSYPHFTTALLGDRFVPAAELAALVPIRIYALDREELAGRFPTRVRISKTRVAWLEREIVRWLNDHQTAASPSDAIDK